MAGTMAPPRRGVPYYDVDRGHKMIVPSSGGKAVPYVEGRGKPAGFDAKRALRRAGVSTVERGDRAAARAPRATVRAVKRSGALPNLGGGPSGAGGLLIYAFATIVGLALLENALSGRGPAGVSTVLDALGGGISKLVSPNDPLVPRGTVPAPAASSSPAAAPAASGTAKVGAGILGVLGPIIGFPYQGSHAKAFNVAGGSDNWQSENAVDIGVPIGTPVYSPAAGVVTKAGPSGGTGRFAGSNVTLQVAGNELFMAHLSSVSVKPGQRVQAGTKLGESGSANGSPHLHLAALTGNPLDWLLRGGK